MSISDVKVTGDIYVPATGTELVTNGDFATGDLTGWDTTNGVTVVANEGVVNYSGAFVSILREEGVTTPEKTYLATFEITAFTSGTGDVFVADDSVEVVALGISSSTGSNSDGTGTYSAIVTAAIGSNGLWQLASDDLVCTIDNISVLELTPGPIDQYPWDSQTDYSAGGEPLGIYNGERVYKSVDTHADGSGGADVAYYVRNRKNNDEWYITQGSPAVSDDTVKPDWNNEISLIGDYPGFQSQPASVGTATVSDISAPFSRTRSRYNADGGLRRRIN